MNRIAVLGAGAFGTALAIALARGGRDVTLWARNPDHAAEMQRGGRNQRRLPDAAFPDGVTPTGDISAALAADTLLLALPMQMLRPFLMAQGTMMGGRRLVACCKGVDLETGDGPDKVIRKSVPTAQVALLSGPGFAADIAAGLPTALTLAMASEAAVTSLQSDLAAPGIRFYRSTDLTGVALGGALKNVMAIACGVTIGAGLGQSARAALLTRGYAEMQRFALAAGAKPETLAGLSGLGDLVLTSLSEKSRNMRFGLALGESGRTGATETTEGIATAMAVHAQAKAAGIEMPLTDIVTALVSGRITVEGATEKLLSRPARSE